jgi:anti-anti-sigma factor
MRGAEPPHNRAETPPTGIPSRFRDNSAIMRPKVFQSERQQDTLIVTPARDSLEVMESELRREVDALHKLMETPGVVNVVVDVGQAPHFGSLIIGALMALCKKANDRGGTAAFCNASDGMLDMLQIMKIDTVMPYFPTRQEALAATHRPRA